MQQTPLVFITFLIIVTLLTILVAMISVFFLLYQRRHHAYLQNLEAIKSQYENEFLTTQLELQEQTFQHISLEIHDNIGQYLSLVKLHLNRMAPDLPEVAAQKLYHVVDLVTKTYADLRDISRNLGAGIIRELGLCEAIEAQVDQLRKTNHYTVTFHTAGNYNYMEEQKEIILYRILQEAINNTIRHAGANTINIVLDCTQPGSVRLSVEDDGTGFDPAPYAGSWEGKKVGGLSNMAARAKVIEADFSIRSVPGKGTRVYISVPHIEPYE
jgi:two-component system NarL family sensor kinase